MFIQYFGSYLLNKGLLNPDQLKEAIELANSTQIKLGILAMNAGFLTADQITEVQMLQRTMDKRFGEIAVLKGYLTDSQVDSLLKTQEKGHLALSQAIADLDFLSLKQLETALQGYKNESGLTNQQISAIQAGDTDTIVRVFLDFSDLKAGDQYYEFASLMMRNIIRFLGELAMIEEQLSTKGFEAPVMVTQEIHGGVSLHTALAMDEETFLTMARKYSGLKMDAGSELADASITEFLNLNNGLFIVNLSNNGVDCDLTPPEITRNCQLTTDQGFVIPFYLGSGTINLIISPVSLG
ncbi:MAG: chemotaxis protein CheX [Solirubrobacterales bacterium]